MFGSNTSVHHFLFLKERTWTWHQDKAQAVAVVFSPPLVVLLALAEKEAQKETAEKEAVKETEKEKALFNSSNR